jgi:hypothetical protein
MEGSRAMTKPEKTADVEGVGLPDWLGARIRELEAKHGGLRAAARALDCDAAYLLRLRDGEKRNPSAAMLRKLGLKKVVTYVLAK